ncbi:MAG: HAMP domain-containing sensor histidine kinase [Cyclobacteriaceae bacterium]
MRRFLLFILILLTLTIVSLLIVQLGFNDAEQIRSRIGQNLNKQLSSQKQDLDDFLDQFAIYSNPFDITSVQDYVKRVYINGKLVYWSDNSNTLSYHRLSSSDTLAILSEEGNVYVVMRESLGSIDSHIEIFSLLPLISNPKVKNQYLEVDYNSSITESYKVRLPNIRSSYSSPESFVRALSIPSQPIYQLDQLILFLATLFIIGVIILMSHFESSHHVKGLLMAAAGVCILRGFLWVLTHELIAVESFSPVNYSSTYASSLGDLLANSVVLFFFLNLLISYLSDKKSESQKQIVTALGIVLINLMGYGIYKVGWSILNNSQITLDIGESIQFDTLRIISTIILMIWTLMFFRVFNFVSDLLRSNKTGYRFLLTFHLVIVVLLTLAVGLGAAFSLLLIFVTFWTIRITNITYDGNILDYKGFLNVSILIAIIALIFSFTVYKQYEKDNLISKKKFANRLLIKNDFLGEYYLSEKLQELKNDPFIRSRISNPLLTQRNVEEKIRNQFLSSYFDKYDVEVYLFDKEKQAIGGHELNFDSLKTAVATPQSMTDYEGIYFVQDHPDKVQDKYYCFVPVTSFDHTVGFVVLSLTLKKYIPKSVFPELMVESRYYFSDDNRFDYAMNKDGKLMYKKGRLEFQNILDYPDLTSEELFKEGLEIDNHHFYGLKTTDGNTLVIASDTYRKASLVSNFSFFYLLILFSFSIYLLLYRFKENKTSFNLSTKIQLYLGLSFVVPMLVVSIALLNTLNDSYKEEIDKSFSKHAYNISEFLIDATQQFHDNVINRDEVNALVSKISSLLQSDINLYSPEGKLMVSSEMEIFNMGLMGAQISPAPYNAIKYGNTEGKVYKESIGGLDFSVAYVALRSYDDGRLVGILSLPYFDSKNHLKRQQIEVFNSLISIFTVIFLISMMVGNLAIEKLIKPLKTITERLKLTDLKEVNEPIEYHSSDEIGILISEYNQMIDKLEESKQALAESQKESAWKEIARQVAHEIKNPLTPMRLKIQQMMREMDRESRAYKSLYSLIDQIDALSSIADSFSAFAKMPAPRNERFDLLGVVKNAARVHSNQEVFIDTSSLKGEIWVSADPKIFSGIMNNIILNAIQATTDKEPTIEISAELKPKKVTLIIKDHGHGIAEENREKIFTPYFSTKATGSGIGLAVAKKGIENAGGNIWFESKEGEGTTFFISLPVIN